MITDHLQCAHTLGMDISCSLSQFLFQMLFIVLKVFLFSYSLAQADIAYEVHCKSNERNISQGIIQHCCVSMLECD